ncbi:cytochrome c-type biogenesis protein CcmH [Aureimonas fodinaquatilis]|uniref:Cytochrome c-type biogenesis protein n=1 Tax=Aureimonas fodinaquatilis TaxID=2565783 RepID=A0A5B0DX53_9HYPH|nr:cytochrome c-type biogenesis protein [Aureimonas fodinaquatilis]KAA0971053.1 cytochrome c-type biogenesis protein CcmH [Aureimonas fodinaquatilis]
MTRFLVAILLMFSLSTAYAMLPDEVLDNPALEQRARDLSSGLRCMVCQNQSIDDSDAPLARDLRLLVRERLTAGDSDNEVIDFLVARYGEFVLLRPRMHWQTVALWALPAILLVCGALFLFTRNRTRPEPEKPLSGEEEQALNQLLDENRR